MYDSGRGKESSIVDGYVGNIVMYNRSPFELCVLCEYVPMARGI